MSSAASPAGFRTTSEESLIYNATTAYLSSKAPDHKVDLAKVRDELLNRISAEFTIETTQRKADKQINNADHPAIAKPKTLDETTVVRVLLHFFDIASIDPSDGEGDADLVELCIYQPPPEDPATSGPDHGIYLNTDSPLKRLIRKLSPGRTNIGVESILKALKVEAPVRYLNREPHLRAVNNGIFDHRTQELEPFTPDYVAFHKIPFNYNPDAESPEIVMHDGKIWTFDGWLESLLDFEGGYQLLWEGIAAVVWPNFQRKQALLPYSPRGNNGKGTYVLVLELLLGDKGSASIPIDQFGERFALSSLIRAQAILVHENAVKAFAKKLDGLKAVVTADKFSLERKHKDPLDMRFIGPVVQCINEIPKLSDKTDSFFRRLIFVPFNVWFGAEGVERTYIKEDYLQRREVLEYVLKVALSMPLAKFSQPQACLDLAAQAQRENDSVRDFWLELQEEFVWDLLPTPFLYDLFIAWFRKNHPSGIPISRIEFTKQLLSALRDDPQWEFSDPQKKHRPGALKMSKPEPLVTDYNLTDWMNSAYNGKNWKSKAVPYPQRVNYRGVVRTHQTIFASGKGASDD